MLEINVFTDGSCLGNPGVGGYAAIMQAKGKERVCTGYSPDVNETNNRMELRAVIRVIDWCNEIQKEPCQITINTDSQYLVNCSNHQFSWLTTSSRKNNDLWLELIQKTARGKHELKFVKVKGHSGQELNERADKLAYAEAVKARHEAFGC